LLLSRLSLQILALATDLGVFKPRDSSNTGDSTEKSSGPTTRTSRVVSQIVSLKKATTWFLNMTDIQSLVAPLLSVAVGVVLISIAFSNTGKTYRGTDAECNINLDADISGDGVRASIWAQIGVLIFISAIGMFHPYDTGIKEVAGGLVLTHTSLVIALIVQMHRGALTSVDAAVGAAILDAQNVALQIPFSHKETLAARWQVILIIPTQILGLTVLPSLVTGLARGDFASEGCECLFIFWWSWISDCGDSSRDDNELSCFYVYYSLRWVMALRLSCEVLYKAGRYHRAEKSARLEIPLTDEEAAKMSAEQYNDVPGTISLSYLICGLYSLTSMTVAEMTTRNFELPTSSSVSSVGQIIAIVIAGSTVLRALWEFVGMFNEEATKGFPDLIFTLLRRLHDYFMASKTCGEKDPEEVEEVVPYHTCSRPQRNHFSESQPSPSSDVHIPEIAAGAAGISPSQASLESPPRPQQSPSPPPSPPPQAEQTEYLWSTSRTTSFSSSVSSRGRHGTTHTETHYLPADQRYRFTFRNPFRLDRGPVFTSNVR